MTAGAYADRHRSCPPERNQELDVGHDVEVSAVKEWYIPKAWAHPGSNTSAVEAAFQDSNTVLCSNESHPNMV